MVTKAIILASGGFESSSSLRRKHLSASWDPQMTGSVESNTGDGLAIGQRLGAAVRRMDSAWWGPVLKLPDEDRARLLTFERALPGSIIVNQSGRRYMNEALAYDQVAVQMLRADSPEAGTAPSFFIFDNAYRRKYPAGPLVPGIPVRLHQQGLRQILVTADKVTELAAAIGVPEDELQATIIEFNHHAGMGLDPAFKRGDSEYERFYGDASVSPNPCLAPLDEPPFFALPIYAGDIGTNGGLVTDDYARVLDEQGMPIPGLYATGNTTASVMGYSYPGAGATLGPAMTFGYVAGMHASGQHH